MIEMLIPQLRNKTGCNYNDCKIALIMSKGDLIEAERLITQFGFGTNYKTQKYIDELAEWNKIKMGLRNGQTFY